MKKNAGADSSYDGLERDTVTNYENSSGRDRICRPGGGRVFRGERA